MNKLNLALIAAAFQLVACYGAVKKAPSVSLDQTAVQTAEKTLCSADQHLKEDKSAYQGKFSSLGLTNKRAYGFSYGQGRCAVTGDIKEDFQTNGQPMHFGMTLPNDCLPNGSLWEITQMTTSNAIITYTLRMTGGFVEMQMEGNPDLSPGYPQSRVGLRALSCQ